MPTIMDAEMKRNKPVHSGGCAVLSIPSSSEKFVRLQHFEVEAR